ncbi:hypothetical protein TSUD_98800 [Trifolium subterraneum]|uniref:Uncharacterized protein n=1 Tax=Trifolium subterraneum TaxID=3900 RepID=A0A2Z6P164_TRISU|nr:hypothetical protein TSUD_98800 [Trifolium subterraneum]
MYPNTPKFWFNWRHLPRDGGSRSVIFEVVTVILGGGDLLISAGIKAFSFASAALENFGKANNSWFGYLDLLVRVFECYMGVAWLVLCCRYLLFSFSVADKATNGLVLVAAVASCWLVSLFPC